MVNLPSYTCNFSEEAVAFIIGLKKPKQKIVLDCSASIAASPFHICDYRMEDANGRSIENLLLEGFLFSYWVDHAAKEVNILEILQST